MDIGFRLRDVMYHMAMSSRKAAGGDVKCSYVITTATVCGSAWSDPSCI